MLKNERNFSLILSSPSGAGKTTLTKKIKDNFTNFEISISHTTRKARIGEIEGKDYFFTTVEDFKEKIESNYFYEYASIFGNLYGSSKHYIKLIQQQNKNLLFDIDWQGARQLSNYRELNVVKFFILPPSKDELIKRLKLRRKDKEKSIIERVSFYEKDIIHWKEYDYIFINDDLETCYSQIKTTIDQLLNKKFY